MRFIAHGFFLTTLALCSTFLAAVEKDRLYTEPVFGLKLEWNRLEPLSGTLHGETPQMERRVLARVPIGANELLYTLSLIPITLDTVEPGPVVGFEVNAGGLVKRVGTVNLTLGGPAERLAEDYPELDPRVLRRLLRDYVANLVKHFGSTQALRQALLDGDFCALADPMAVMELDRVGITDACLTTHGPDIPRHGERQPVQAEPL